MRTISHEELITELGERMAFYRIPYADTKKVICEYEKLVKDCLKNVGDKEDDLKIKIMDGIFVERHYVPEQEMKKGALKGKIIKEHFNLKTSVSKYFRDNLNKWFFDRESRYREWYESDDNRDKLFYHIDK